MARLLVLLAASCSCYVSPYVRSGRAALEQGKAATAMADFLEAHRSTAGGPEREAIRRDLEAATLAWARHQGELALHLADDGNEEAALERAWTVATASWLDDAARAEAIGAAARLTERVWPTRVASHVERGHFVPATRAARALTAHFPAGHPIHTKRLAVEERAREAHARLAQESGNHRFARRLHRCLEDYFAGQDRCQDPPSPYRPVAWKIEPVAGDCTWVSEGVAAALGKPNAQPMKVSLAVSSCPRAEKRWTDEESYSYFDQEPFIAEIDEPVLEAPDDCPEPACARPDSLGTCVTWEEAEPCEPGEPTWTTRRKKVRRFQRVEREAVRTVHHASFAAELRGSARFAWEGETITLPVSADIQLEDRAFWSPQEQRQFGSMSLATATRQALDVVAETFREFRGKRVHRHGVGLVERGQAAEESGDRMATEGAYFESVRALGEPLSPVVRYFGDRYGLGAADLTALAAGGMVAWPDVRIKPATMPSASEEARAAVRDLMPVSPKAIENNRMFRISVEVAGIVEQSPLDDTDLSTGVVATIRGGEGNVWFQWRLDSPNLGGDARGFGVGIQGGETFAGGKVALMSGVAYREQRNDAGERYAVATLPFTFYWLPLSWLVVDADMQLNLIKIRDWTGNGPNDPGYGSPFSVGLTLQADHLFLQARGTTWLGMETEQIFYAGGLVGVRL